jgi:3-oxoacyl-[acyl-carrier-protein] synthase-1
VPREQKAGPLAVTGIGMVTPLGLDAYESCASLRAGISLMQELEYFSVENDWFEEVPLVGCPITGITDGMLGLGRWTKLAARALEDLLENTGLDRKNLVRVGLSIALPPLERPGVDPRIASDLGLRLSQWLEVPDLEKRTRVYAGGHAASIKAVIEACGDLESERLDQVIVGGVDSLIEPETLGGLVEKRRLKTEDNVDGFIPGEAAAFFLLELPEKAKERGATVLALLDGVGVGEEPSHSGADKPSQATGLSEAIVAAFAPLPDKGMDTGLVVCDLNGETYRAKEFGTAVPRVLSHVAGPFKLWHAADSIGDTGAASAAVSTCVAARALQRGYARSKRALVFGGSDGGLRGALSLVTAA